MPRGIWAGAIYWIFFFAMLILAIRHDIRQPEPAIINHRSEIGQAGTEKKGDARQQQKSLTEGLTDDPVAFATLIVAFATGALAISPIGLRRVTRRSVDVAERALTELERPFILPSVQPSVLKARRAQRHRIFLEFEIGNYGRTPAIITHSRVACVLRDKEEGLTPPTIRDSDWIPDLVLAPGEKSAIEHADFPTTPSYNPIPIETGNSEIIPISAGFPADYEL